MINNEPRYASLSSGLLARKGTAKPAMRPQGFNHAAGFEDLGWNDMGHEPAADGFEHELPEHVPSSIAALTPAPKLVQENEPAQENEPEVVAQQRAIAESFAPEAEDELETEAAAEEIEPAAPAEIVALPKRQPAPTAIVAPGRKSAFTLRLDAERHLRLRLACAVTGRSAQQIVTSALDALIESIPEVETLAERVPSASAKRR
jgi:hypothetical protein